MLMQNNYSKAYFNAVTETAQSAVIRRFNHVINIYHFGQVVQMHHFLNR